MGQLNDHDALHGGFEYVLDAVCVFSAVTAVTAVTVVSVVSGFGVDGFKVSQHATSLNLTYPDWLDDMCKILDKALVSGLKYNQIVSALAVIHSAPAPNVLQAKDRIIAWRSGIYSVVPSLLLSMSASPGAVALQCIDTYWANVNVREDGSIKSVATRSLLEDWLLIEEIQGENSSSLQPLSRPWMGLLRPGPPNVPFYMTIETTLHYSQPDLCFVGRIGGSVIGSMGVLDVLRDLFRNMDELGHCPCHTSPFAVINVKASQWANSRRANNRRANNRRANNRRAKSAVRTYAPVEGYDWWAIFVSGQSCYSNGRLALRCADCTVERAGSGSVVV